MNISRRSLLLGVPAAAAALVACPAVAFARPTVNVRDYGAVGDGIADDADAIAAAVAAVGPGSTLYFPGGRYRFARHHPPGDGAIAITGISDVEIKFEPGAELVMDNVAGATGMGTGHGIVIRGPASNISLRDITIRWAQPSTRSVGDGIRIVGYPTGVDPPPAGREPTRRCAGSPSPVPRSAPARRGVIMMGVSDIDVTGLRVQESRGDGLHFNACRQARIDDYTATDTGDDGLALVTYYSEEAAFDSAAETFSFPQLTEWSDTDFTVTNVTVQGGRANGVRLAGASGVSITSLGVTGTHFGAGVIVDSASVGSDVAWEYVASKGIRMSAIAVQDCESGIHVLARPDDTRDQRFSDFDVHVSDATMRRCANWGVRAESLTDLRMTGLQVDTCSVDANSTSGGHGGVGLGDSDDIGLRHVTIRHQQPVTIFESHNSAGIFVEGLQVAIADPNGPRDPKPCIKLDESGGVLDGVTVKWQAAPDFWHPIRITNHGVGCSEQSGPSPVTIRALGVDPASVTNPVTRC